MPVTKKQVIIGPPMARALAGMELSLLPRRKAMRIRQETEKLLLEAEVDDEE